MRASRLLSCLVFAMALDLWIVSVPGQGSVSISVTTDKSSYDRGQVITMTGIVAQSGNPVPNTVVVFELRDSQNNVKASGYMTTDQNGAFSRTLTVGGDFPDGAYSVLLSVTLGNETASSVASFQVVREFRYGTELLILFAFVAVFAFLRKLIAPVRGDVLYRDPLRSG